ncbi:MAG: hypothetical protein PSX36_05095 [bacterium]|nr:hypothetical protein [bacterium]
MDSVNIRNHEDLRKHLSYLIAEKEKRSVLIIADAKEVVEVFYHPAKIIKKTIGELAGDTNFRSDLILIAVNAASNFIGRKVAGTTLSALLTLLIDKVTAGKKGEPTSNFLSKIFSTISGKKSGQNKSKESEL